MDIREYLETRRKQVDAALEIFMPVEEGSLAEHFRAMRYSLFAGGKRVRPILCLAAAESVKNFNNRGVFSQGLVKIMCSAPSKAILTFFWLEAYS